MKNKQKIAGFTLIELLVTIVIIGILATISVATFGGYQEKAKTAKDQAECAQIDHCNKTKSVCEDSGDTPEQCDKLCDSGLSCSASITHNGLSYGTITSSDTGRIWLDRNIGATRLSNSTSEAASIGNNNGLGTYFDSTDGINACPEGFRLPTQTEWRSEFPTGNFNDHLERVSNFGITFAGGYHNGRSGDHATHVLGGLSLFRRGDSSTGYVTFSSTGYMSTGASSWAHSGFSVRCIKDE